MRRSLKRTTPFSAVVEMFETAVEVRPADCSTVAVHLPGSFCHQSMIQLDSTHVANKVKYIIIVIQCTI